MLHFHFAFLWKAWNYKMFDLTSKVVSIELRFSVVVFKIGIVLR